MKAIHNNGCSVISKRATVFNTSKIQNESNSQQTQCLFGLADNCV